MLQSGQPAPDFSLPRDGGDLVTLSLLTTCSVVLYFYPRDDTSGCTKESIAFSNLLPDFSAAGATVLGISGDSVKKHDRFRDKHGLKVALLSDEDNEVCKRYGVWVEKMMYGREFMGIERSTILIDGTGIVRQIWRKVKVDGHAEEVLLAVRALENQ